MSQRLAIGLLVLCVACDVRAAELDDCLRDFIDIEAIRAIVKAKTPAELEGIRARTPFRNHANIAVYALRRYELEKTSATESDLIESVPHSDIELLLLYRLTYPDVEIEGRHDLFADYVAGVYEVVRSQRRYAAFLRLGVLARGGELGETITSYIERLYDADPAGVTRELRSMPEAERVLICGDEAIPCPTTEKRRRP